MTCSVGRVVSLLAVVISVGCQSQERKLSASDCEQVRKTIVNAWYSDANAAVNAAERSDFRRWVKGEADRISDEWMKQCEPMVGRTVSQRELDCLLEARQIDQVVACQPRQ